MEPVATPDDRFTFGLWTVGWQGRDPFGSGDEYLSRTVSDFCAALEHHEMVGGNPLKERATAFRADPEVVAAYDASGLQELAQPTLAPGETAADLLATDRFAPDLSAERGWGVERLDQLALEDLLGAC